jgi:MFS family permease
MQPVPPISRDRAVSRPTPAAPRRLGRDFSRFWTAQATSAFGAQIGDLALPLLAVLTLGASAGEVGLLAVLRWLPFLLLALPLGVLVDRRRRRPLLVGADVARAILTGVIVVLAVCGVLNLGLLGVVVFSVGIFTVLFEVSYQSYLPAVVGRPGLERANGRLQATASAAQVGGPGLAGLLVQALGGPWAVLAHALTYGASALALIGIRTREEAPTPTGRRFWRDLVDGLNVVRADPILVSLAGFSGIYNLFAQWIMVLFTVHAVRDLGLDAGGVGLVLSLGAVGAVLGALAAARAVRRWGAGVVLVACAVAECLALAVLPILEPTAPQLVIMSALVAAFAVNGAGTALSSVVALTIRQLRTPDRVLGRVNATLRWLTYGTVAVGAGLGGLAGELWGTRFGIAIGCSGLLLVVLWVARSPLRSVRDPQSLDVTEAPAATSATPHG